MPTSPWLTDWLKSVLIISRSMDTWKDNAVEMLLSVMLSPLDVRCVRKTLESTIMPNTFQKIVMWFSFTFPSTSICCWQNYDAFAFKDVYHSKNKKLPWLLSAHPSSKKAVGICQKEIAYSGFHSTPTYVSRLRRCSFSPARKCR